jgi:RNA polymerase sigma-70 factor (ECF subfamily)
MQQSGPATDHALLEAARRGDRAAIEALLDRHQARIYRFGMKMCGNPEDARDVLQETLLAMARTLPSFRGESSVSTWLYSIARSFCGRKRRKSKFAPDDVQSLDTDLPLQANRLADPRRLPDEILAGKELYHALERSIDSLDPLSREVLLLRDFEGLTAPEVAQVLGVGVDAIKSRLHRARLTVRSAMAPLLGPASEKQEPAKGRCPDVLSLYSRHLEGDIDSDLCAEMENHIAACARCRAACDSLKRVLAVCRSVPAERVPEPLQQSVRAEILKVLPVGP